MRWVWKIGVMLACLVLVACGGGNADSSPDADEDPTAAASPTAPAPEMTIGTITWSESADEATGEPAGPVETFTPQSRAIIATIEVTNVPAGTEFTANWTLNDQPIQVNNMQVRADSDLDHAWVSFQFTREEGEIYPTGQLGVVITASTGELREGSIAINWP